MAEGNRRKRLIINGVIVVILIAGWFIIRKSGIMTRKHQYYVFYKDVKGLQASSSVNLRGVRVGKIADIDLNDSSDVRVTLSIPKDIEIPEGTIAVLSSGGFTGEKIIILEVGKGPAILHDFATISTLPDSDTKQATVKIGPYMATAKSLLNYADTTLRGLNKLIGTGVVNPIARSIYGLEKMTDKYSGVSQDLNKKVDGIAPTLNNADRSAQKMAESSREWPKTSNDVATSTAELAKKDLKKNVTELQASFKQLHNSFSKLNTTDKSAYTKAVTTIDSLNADMKETREHPKGFRLIGKDKKR